MDHGRSAAFVQYRDQGLTHAQALNGFSRIKGGIRPEAIGRRAQATLLDRCVGAQGVLNPISQLAQHRLGNICRVLGDEIDADALRADEAYDLLDFLQQGFGGIAE